MFSKEETIMNKSAMIGVLSGVAAIAIFANSTANAENNLSNDITSQVDMTANAVFLVSEEVTANSVEKYRNAKTLTKEELIDLLKLTGFEGKSLKIAWATAMKESMGNPKSFNGNKSTGDNSYGLFQINMLGYLGAERRDQFNLDSNKDLFDPVTNAAIAYHMSDGGKDWSAWKGITWKTKEWMERY